MKEKYFNFTLPDEYADEMDIRRGFTIVMGRETLHRLIQEEIWAQTSWPDGETELEYWAARVNKTSSIYKTSTR